MAHAQSDGGQPTKPDLVNASKVVDKTLNYLNSPGGNRLEDFWAGMGAALSGMGGNRFGQAFASDPEREKTAWQQFSQETKKLGYKVHILRTQPVYDVWPSNKIADNRAANFQLGDNLLTVTAGIPYARLSFEEPDSQGTPSTWYVGPENKLELEGGSLYTSSLQQRQDEELDLNDHGEKLYDETLTLPSGDQWTVAENQKSPRSTEERLNGLWNALTEAQIDQRRLLRELGQASTLAPLPFNK